MKNRTLLAVVILFAGISIASCSKEKINEIAKNHSRDNARSSGQSSSSDYSSPSSDYGSCNNHGDNSGSGSSNSGSGSN